ncbi:hypothetical protein Acr_24g0013070 [Actinidia rufa]|uniref:Uncharacterized protein n=1 Tax=Actinidia rufa TaxID=165716 RepID=A0A7J0GW91_9ERIC|nr:hypothetical protein Acr_24g0013070 [Actinidia rufa]
MTMPRPQPHSRTYRRHGVDTPSRRRTGSLRAVGGTGSPRSQRPCKCPIPKIQIQVVGPPKFTSGGPSGFRPT